MQLITKYFIFFIISCVSCDIIFCNFYCKDFKNYIGKSKTWKGIYTFNSDLSFIAAKAFINLIQSTKYNPILKLKWNY